MFLALWVTQSIADTQLHHHNVEAATDNVSTVGVAMCQ